MHKLWLIPALPFIGFLINGIFGRKLPKTDHQRRRLGSVVLAFIWVLLVVLALRWAPTPLHAKTISPGFKSGVFNVGWDFAVDRLTDDHAA